jgi:hypothetical protein
MKNAVVCLAAMLMCACCREMDDSNSQNSGNAVRTNDKVNRLLKEHYPSFSYTFQARGPLSVAEFEQELIREHDESNRIRERMNDPTVGFADSEIGRDYVRFKSKYRQGDELYFFESDLRSWTDRRGMQGYVLIRGDRLVDGIVTVIN